MFSHGYLKAFVVAGFVCALVVSSMGAGHAAVTFTDIVAGLEGVDGGSVAWGDYDNDGDLDILLTGNTGSVCISRVYRNDGGLFTDIGAGLVGVAYSSAAWGDYDNDGDLDILLTGDTSSFVRISRVYRNDGGIFTDIGAGLEGVRNSSVAWGDYDNDGDLDILLTGHNTSSVPISRIYRSDGAPANTAPAAPAGLSASVAGDQVTFSWTAATDAETPSAGLSYNLRAGTTPGGCEIVSPMADPASGYRRVVQLGNGQQRTSWTLTMEPGTCYWSVQALDAAWAGSAFADEKSLHLTGVEEEMERFPTALFLGPAVPNPFNPLTRISYGIPAGAGTSRVTINIYDALGRRVTNLVDERQGPGTYHAFWDGCDHKGVEVSSGVYFCRIRWNGETKAQRVVLLK